MRADTKAILARKQARLLLAMACAYELGNSKKARILFLLAMNHGFFRTKISAAQCHVAAAGVWLIKKLALHPQAISVLFPAGKAAGFSRHNLQSAARILDIVYSKRVGCGIWCWAFSNSQRNRKFRNLGIRMCKAANAPKAPKATGSRGVMMACASGVPGL